MTENHSIEMERIKDTRKTQEMERTLPKYDSMDYPRGLHEDGNAVNDVCGSCDRSIEMVLGRETVHLEEGLRVCQHEDIKHT